MTDQRFIRGKKAIAKYVDQVTARDIRRDIARTATENPYLKSTGVGKMIDTVGQQFIDVPQKVSLGLAKRPNGLTVFYANVVKLLTQLRQQGEASPLLDKYQEMIQELHKLVGDNEPPVFQARNHIVRALFFNYDDGPKGGKAHEEALARRYPYEKGGSGITHWNKNNHRDINFFKDSQFHKDLIKRLIKRIVATEAVLRASKQAGRNATEPTPGSFYLDQGAKVANGKAADYSGPPSGGSDGGALGNIAGEVNAAQVGFGVMGLGVVLVGGVILTKTVG